MESALTKVYVNNELELCEVFDPDCKKQIERQLLENRISFFIRWPKSSIFSHKKDNCIICVNENVHEEAESIVRALCDETGYSVRFILKKHGRGLADL